MILQTLRKTLFWAHLVAGCAGGLVILLMSVTGVLLTYERQMIAWAERGSYVAEAKDAGAMPLPIEDVLVRAGIHGTPTVTLRSKAGEPVEVQMGRGEVAYLDPYNGLKLGSPDKSAREFFQKLRGWHRWIALEGSARATGRAITGACTLAFVGLVLSGLYLWMPRVWRWQSLKPIVWFRGGLQGKARDFNWHNTIGIWSAVPLLAVIVSALPISYPWANQLVYDLTGTEMPKTPRAPEVKGEWNPNGLNRMVAEVMKQEGWQSISFRVGPGEEPIAFTVDRGDGGQPQLKSTLTLERASGAVLKQEMFSDFNTGRRVRMFTRFLHTGEALGLVGQTVAGLVSLGGAVLVWTGIALSLRRFRSWRKRRVSGGKLEEPEEVSTSAGVPV